MERDWLDFGHLHLRGEQTLTADERGSLAYLTGFIDELHGLTRGTEPRRWCFRARQIREFALAHGRLPQRGDAEVPTVTVRWMTTIGRDDLNSFQRMILEQIPGWVWD